MHERIGKYHVIRAAGSGGFGVVYEGFDLELNRNVAIKICTGGEGQIERFRREARIVSQLQHHNIALVFDFGFDKRAGVHYLVEEFLSGVDLDRKLEDRDRLPPLVRLRYLMGIIQGLGFVHDRGLIHRDLSPRNIRVLHDHTVKIMDFGLAKDTADSTLTQIGDNFGTMGYTAPEQVTGMRTVDHRADIFSFGVIAYELLTFSNPFMAENMGTFIHKIHHLEPPPLTELWPECPAELAEVVQRCIRKAPEERYSSCSEILAVLKKALRPLRRHDFPAPYGPPPSDESDSFAARLDAVGRPSEAPPLAPVAPGRIGRRTGDVDSSRLTNEIRGLGASPTQPAFDLSMPIAPTTEPAPELGPATEAASTVVQEQPTTLMPAKESRASLPGYLLALAFGAGLTILVFAMMRPAPEAAIAAPQTVAGDLADARSHPPATAALGETSLSEETGSEGTGATERASGDGIVEGLSAAPSAPVFELVAIYTGTPERPSIQLLADLPPELIGLSHCYVLRTPRWSYGIKIRRDCPGETFRHVDRDDVRPGESYTYRVQAAAAGGQVLAESSRSSVHAGDES